MEELKVRLYGKQIASLALLPNERSLLIFDESYIEDQNRPILSQSFYSQTGQLLADSRPVQTKLPSFFSNLLPEGYLRQYLAEKGGVNSDMHLKNWSLIYPDKRLAQLSPAYDFVSTVPYLPNDKLALTLMGERELTKITVEHFVKMANKLQLPKYLVKNAVQETTELTRETWKKGRADFNLPNDILIKIDAHMDKVKL